MNAKKKMSKNTLPLNSAILKKKVYKSSVQSLLLLIKQPLECLLLIKIKKKNVKIPNIAKKDPEQKKHNLKKKRQKKINL